MKKNKKAIKQYSSMTLFRDYCDTGRSDAEDILLDAFYDILHAKKSRKHYRRLDFFRSLRQMVNRAIDDPTAPLGADEQQAVIVRLIAAYLTENR